MHSSVVDGYPIDSGLCVQEVFELCLDVLDDCIPTVSVVDVVAEPRGVDNCQL